MATTAPTVVVNRVFTLDEISKKADPEWPIRRDFTTAYQFSNRNFVDNRNNVYSN